MSPKLIYFGVKKSKVKVTSHKQHCRRWSLHSCECLLLFVVYAFTRILWSRAFYLAMHLA